MTWPMPPPVPISPMIARMMSLAVDPVGQLAVDRDRHPLRPFLRQRLGGEHVLDLARADAEGDRRRTRRGWRCGESPQTIVMPGMVRPCSGPMTWTMPWPGSPIGKLTMPNSAVFAAQRVDLLGRDRVGDRLVDVGGRHVVVLGGDVRSGRRTPRPDSRRPSNACGLVTSCTRWRSMYSRSGSPGAACTTWRSQTFSGSVFGSGSVSAMCGAPGALRSCRVPTIGIEFLRYGHRNGRRRTRQGDDDSRRDRVRAALARRAADRHRAAPGDGPPARRRRSRRTGCCGATTTAASSSARTWSRSAGRPPGGSR